MGGPKDGLMGRLESIQVGPRMKLVTRPVGPG